MSRRPLAFFAASVLVVAALLAACSGDEPVVAAPPPVPPPAPPAAAVQEPLVGGPYPTLLLAQAQFVKGADGKPKPGPALVTLWRKAPEGWQTVKLEDSDSNVFHKALPYEGGILTIGAEKAWLKDWRWADGKWAVGGLWNPKWEGKFNRIRDLEIGDVDGDGAPEFVMATHDSGVVAVAKVVAGSAQVIELDKAADTFVHEIEIGDIDGDGKNEFFATPSGRNQSSGKSQPGQVVMYRWDGTTYVRSVVDDLAGSHAKEILAVDLTGKGKSDLFAVIEAETELVDGKAKVVKPVEIRHYTPQKDGSWKHEVAATIDDKQTRFLVPGDFDGDGQIELVAAAMKTGIWVLEQGKGGVWTSTNIEPESGGFEHAAHGADLDGDGKLELYVASDEQHELRSYVYDATTKTYVKTVLGPIPDKSITWNITSGSF
ncbi:MAG: VCBS repeat-containing protein [Pseudomonadota bacterium]|nr:VCBS repeat-containing protein [Pseudomonadota bacterium]